MSYEPLDLTVSCPYCDAPAGRFCVKWTSAKCGYYDALKPHVARRRLAREEASRSVQRRLEHQRGES